MTHKKYYNFLIFNFYFILLINELHGGILNRSI